MGELDEFREWVRESLATRLEPRRADAHTSVLGAGNDDLAAGRKYLSALFDVGLGAPTWPRQYGGCDATPAQL